MYYFIKEYWIKFGKYMTCNHAKDIISQNIPISMTAYGSLSIYSNQPMISKWDVLVLTLDGHMDIGIDSSLFKDVDANFVNRNVHDDPAKFYAYSCDGTIHSFQDHHLVQLYGESYYVGDIISIILNTKEKTIEFLKNDVSQGIAFQNIDVDNKDYSLAVSLWHHTMVKIWGFQQISPQAPDSMSVID